MLFREDEFFGPGRRLAAFTPRDGGYKRLPVRLGAG